MNKTSKATFEDFVRACWLSPGKNHLRAGQHAFNVLQEMRPDIANEVRNSDNESDPFYDDANLVRFYYFVLEMWRA